MRFLVVKLFFLTICVSADYVDGDIDSIIIAGKLYLDI